MRSGESERPTPWLAYLAMAAAYLVGSASLVLFGAFLFVGSFQLVDLGFRPVGALVWDALLSAAFFVQHSGMVRRGFRERLERRVPAPFHGLVYTVASGSTLALCLLLWQRVGEPLVTFDGVSGWVLRALFFLALAGFAWGIRALGSLDTLGVEPALAVVGPYRWVRHPLYLFSLVLFWSCPAATADRLLFDVLWTLWVVLATTLEERDLVAKFGDAYLRYQRDVPMLFPWRRPAPPAPGSAT